MCQGFVNNELLRSLTTKIISAYIPPFFREDLLFKLDKLKPKLTAENKKRLEEILNAPYVHISKKDKEKMLSPYKGL